MFVFSVVILAFIAVILALKRGSEREREIVRWRYRERDREGVKGRERNREIER
jgi:hypothetical protein